MVACQVGTPFTRAKICPFVPVVVVEIDPVPLPRRTVFDWMLPQPVPPLVVGKIPVTSAEAISISVPKSAVTLPAEYVRPPEKVVVAPEYINPLVSRANPPDDSDGKKRSDDMVDDAVEKKPFSNPKVVVVEL